MQPKIYNEHKSKNATMGSVLKIFSTDTDPVHKDISQNIHFDVVLSVFIHPCTKKRRRAQFSIHAELTRLSVSVAEPDVFIGMSPERGQQPAWCGT